MAEVAVRASVMDPFLMVVEGSVLSKATLFDLVGPVGYDLED